jgi:hypothetical protein
MPPGAVEQSSLGLDLSEKEVESRCGLSVAYLIEPLPR